MAKPTQPSQPPIDPLASVAMPEPAAPPPAAVKEPVPEEPPPPPPPSPSKPSGPPAAAAKTYRVLEAVPRVSVNGQITTFTKDQVISELGYNIEKLKSQGVKLELVKE